jgi:hypothetical protein
MRLDDSGSDACLSDLVLDRLRTGELPSSTEAAAHLPACARCAARAAALGADARRFDEEQLVPRLAFAARKRARGRSLWLPVASGLLAAAVLLLYVHGRPPAPGLRSKGRGALDMVVRRSDGRVEPVAAGTPLHPGESVRFIVSTDEAGYLAIVGADARQVVTAYEPASGAARPIAAGRRQIVDGSVVLDDALGAERMIAVVCARPLSVETVTAAARTALTRADRDPRRMSRLELDCAQLSLVIEKVPVR